MKARVAKNTMCGKLCIQLVSFIIILSGFSNSADSQGWSFAPSIAESDCAGTSYLDEANAVLAQFSTSVKMPTKSQCEALRQSINGFSVGGDWYSSGNPPVHHYCSISITCTACTGSDIVTPGQLNPGDVSFDWESTGNPFFTTHQSEAFENWARDYKALLESYGIKSILGNRFDEWLIPLTGDKNFDGPYSRRISDFNPPAPIKNTVDSGVYVGGSRVANSMDDFLNKKVVIPGGRSPEDATQQDKWYQDHLAGQGYTDFGTMSPNNGLDPAHGPSWDENSGVYKGVQGMIDKIGENPNGVLAAYIGNLELDIGKNVFQYLDQARDAIANGTEADLVANNPNPEQTILMQVVKDQVNNKVEEIQSDLAGSFKEAAVNTGEKIMGGLYGNKGAEDFKMTLNFSNTASNIFDKVKNAASWLGSNNEGNH
jgi:hypothetical protein